MARPAHRPNTYTKKVGLRICELIKEGLTLNQIIARKEPGFPANRSTILDWTYDHKEFYIAYLHAREMQQHVMVDQLRDIAADDSNDYFIDAKGIRRSDNTATLRHRLMCDNIKWAAERIAGKHYAQRLHQELTGKDGGAIAFQQIVDKPPLETPEQWERRVASQIQERQREVIQ